MEIEYQLTEADIIALMEYRLQHIPRPQNPIWIRRLGYAVGFALLSIGSVMLTNNRVLPFIFLILAISTFLLYPAFFYWLMRRKVSAKYRDEQNRATLATRTLRATSEGLEEISSLGEIKIKWEAIEDLAVTPTYTIISIQQIPSMIIPKHGVSTGDYESFVNTCRQFLEGGAV